MASRKKSASRRKRLPHEPQALIIVDVQRAFSPPPRFLARIRKYAARFPRLVFTRFVNPRDSLFRRKLKQHSCAPGSPDTELLIEPGPRDLVFNKHGYGLEASHVRKLRRAGIKHAIVCGLDTDACVLGVMFSLFDAGIVCRAKENLCWSSTGLQRAGLQIIREQFPKSR